MITFDEAKELEYRDEIYSKRERNSDGTPQRWQVNGKVKLWKTRPTEIQVPIKHGLYDYGNLDEMTLDRFCLSEESALGIRYNIVRMYAEIGRSSRIIERNVTIEEAHLHCQDPQTSSTTCTTSVGRKRTATLGPWFDGFEEVKA